MNSQDKALEKQHKEMTIKQRRWLEAYIKTGNKTEAARLAGYQADSPEGFGQIGYENYKKLDVAELFEEIGATDKELIQTIRLGYRNATRKIPVKQLKYFDKEKVQEVTETIYADVPDYAVRERYARDAFDLKHKLTNEGQNTTNIGQMNFVWGNPSPTTEPREIIDVTPEKPQT